MDKFLQVTIRQLENGDYYFDYQFKNNSSWTCASKDVVKENKAKDRLLQLFELAMVEFNES